MTLQITTRALEIFESIVDLPADAAAAAITNRCGTDRDLTDAVQRLLASDANAKFSWSKVGIGIRGELINESVCAAQTPPAVIGSFRIGRVLGEGATGIVYEAEQAQPQRKVALKLFRFGAADDRARHRFAIEAESLGRLRHPGICRIYEAGIADTTIGNLPYIAMELVDGISFSEFANTHQYTVRQRLELLIRVCEAVTYANQNGVIHRDLKPANIFVEGPTEAPVPRVLDFGVARLTDQDPQMTLATRAGQLVGTLPYMSPEQIGGGDVDVTTDVYSLGVIGYELLSGRLPIDVEPDSMMSTLSTICRTPAKRLSAEDRRLRGDLDLIFAKALEKDRHHRYPTVAEFAADLKRFVENRPIHARSAGVIYRGAKCIRRHPRTMGLTFVVALLAASFGWTALEVRSARAERRAIARDILTNIVDYQQRSASRPERPFRPTAAVVSANILGSVKKQLEPYLSDIEHDPKLLDSYVRTLEVIARTGGGLRQRTLDYILTAAAIRREQAATSTDYSVHRNLVDDLLLAGDLQENPSARRAAYQEADRALKRIDGFDRGLFHSDRQRIAILRRIGDLANDEEETEKAIHYYEEVIELAKRLAAERQANFETMDEWMAAEWKLFVLKRLRDPCYEPKYEYETLTKICRQIVTLSHPDYDDLERFERNLLQLSKHHFKERRFHDAANTAIEAAAASRIAYNIRPQFHGMLQSMSFAYCKAAEAKEAARDFLEAEGLAEAAIAATELHAHQTGEYYEFEYPYRIAARIQQKLGNTDQVQRYLQMARSAAEKDPRRRRY